MVLQLDNDSLQCAKSSCRLVAFHLKTKRETSGEPEGEKDKFLFVCVCVPICSALSLTPSPCVRLSLQCKTANL